MTLRSRLARLPGALRLASISTWRNKERGLAIVSGVFLASLVVTMVFVYGSGLNQIFFQESLEGEPFDGKVEFQPRRGTRRSVAPTRPLSSLKHVHRSKRSRAWQNARSCSGVRACGPTNSSTSRS